MPIELRMLALSIVLGSVQLLAAAHSSTKQRGLKWNLSPRDEKMPDLTGIAGRLDRAFRNFMETFPFFLAAVFLVTFLKANNAISALGAQLYFFARLVYVPVYAMGTPVVRTVIWIAALIGMMMVLSALFCATA